MSKPHCCPRQLTWVELSQYPTLHQGQFSNLKIDTGTMRVWLSRMRIVDGETQPVQVERLEGGSWVDITAPDDGKDGYKDIPLDGEYAGYSVYARTWKVGIDLSDRAKASARRRD